jgi:hypothetical protein
MTAEAAAALKMTRSRDGGHQQSPLFFAGEIEAIPASRDLMGPDRGLVAMIFADQILQYNKDQPT